jgi:preprotein translocase subunit SecA
VDWVFNLPEERQSYFKFMRSPLEHFSRENISYLKKISYPEKETPTKITKVKIGRNAPCPCGSGKKYKKCCMKL